MTPENQKEDLCDAESLVCPACGLEDCPDILFLKAFDGPRAIDYAMNHRDTLPVTSYFDVKYAPIPTYF